MILVLQVAEDLVGHSAACTAAQNPDDSLPGPLNAGAQQ
jgi:hypothetical protein